MDCPLEYRREPLQRASDILVGIVSLLYMERPRDDELMATLEPPVESRHNRGAGIARHAHRARRQGRLLPEERHRQAILKEIAIGEDTDQLATLQRRQHPPEPTGCHLFQAGTPAFTEVGHRGIDELRHRASHQGRERVPVRPEDLPDVIERPEMGGYDDPAPAGCHHLIEMPPALLRDVYGCAQVLRRRVGNVKQIDEITGAVAKYLADRAPDHLGGRAGSEHLRHIRSDVLAVGGKERVDEIAATVGDPVGDTLRQNPHILAQQPGAKHAQPDLEGSIC